MTVLSTLGIEAVVWFVGGAIFAVYVQFIAPLFPDNRFALALYLFGCVFLFGVVAPIVMAIRHWRKYRIGNVRDSDPPIG